MYKYNYSLYYNDKVYIIKSVINKIKIKKKAIIINVIIIINNNNNNVKGVGSIDVFCFFVVCVFFRHIALHCVLLHEIICIEYY